MIPHVQPISFRNGKPVPLAELPVLGWLPFHDTALWRLESGDRIASFFGVPVNAQTVRLYLVLANAASGMLHALATDVGDHYPALTRDCSQFHWFEREIAEQWGVHPDGHPWLKPLRFHASYRPGKDAWNRAAAAIQPGVTNYFRVEGHDVHEVAVGPIHAGVIEPGHFRFQCHGEQVFHLEIELGYQHRGIERKLIGGPNTRTLHYMETVAGDASVAHAVAYCELLEGLTDTIPPLRAQALRAIAMELERLANHTGDLGALALDVGFLPTAAFCGRLRGDFLNATALLCGNRFGRGLVRPGGVRFNLNAPQIETALEKLRPALRDVDGACQLMWNSSSVQARFEDCGTLTRETAEQLGLVGMAARACGIEIDVRHDHPSGMYRFAQLPVSTWHTGDVAARAYVRWLEAQRSGKFVCDQLAHLPAGEIGAERGKIRPQAFVASLAEGWRGEICHTAITDHAGRFAHYKVVDPSFHNWSGLAMALRNQEISDFPVNNKSFNLSYCGHDL